MLLVLVEPPYGPASSLVITLYRRSVKLFQVHLTGTFTVSREAGKLILAHGGGAIVNIASVSGQRGNIGRSAYGASKGGVITLTKVMAS